MNAYRIPMHDAELLAGSTDELGDVRAELRDAIATDYDRMVEVYDDAADRIVQAGDMGDVLRALDRASYMLGKLRDGETSIDNPDTLVLLRELARQAELVTRGTDAALDERVESELES